MKYYQAYFKHKPKDDFGYSSEWNQEIDKWLEFLFSIDSTYYDASKKRVLIDKQRDEFLGEIKTLYFLGKILGLNITAIEPDGNGNTKLDLEVEDLDSKSWKVEVKSPSWSGQLWKSPNHTKEEKLFRSAMPKHVNGEGEWFSSEEEIEYAAEDSIKNALPKFKSDDNNLLVIVPDMKQQIITMLGISAMAGGSQVVQGQIEFQDLDGLTSCVLILEPVLFSGSPGVKYLHKFIPIKQKPKLPFIAEYI